MTEMPEYVKINTIWKRDERGHIIPGDYSTDELAFLADCRWEWTEKVDGTNVRVGWNGSGVEFGGRTANAQMPTPLVATLRSLFSDTAPFAEAFGAGPAVLYGEGYGARIQDGGKYAPEASFVLFDVRVSKWWLRRDDVLDVAARFGLRVVPIVGAGSLTWASDLASKGITSTWGDFPAEGLVGRPAVELLDRAGHRVMAKIKTRDFH